MSASIRVEGCWASSETSIPNSATVRTLFEDYRPKPGQKFDLVAALFGVPSHIGDPDLLSGKVQWLLNPGGTAVLMYNGGKPEDMDFYRNLGTKMHGSDGAKVSDEFWTEPQDDDPGWLTVVSRSPDP